MNRNQLEKLYTFNGLNDFRLKSTDDLLNVHDIDYTQVKGYDTLDDINRNLYKKAIINLFNAFGLDSRATFQLKAINFVEHFDLIAKEDPADEYSTIVGSLVKVIKRDGKKKILRNWVHKDYKHLEITQSQPKTYLRIEYKMNGRNEWLHIIDEKEWY